MPDVVPEERRAEPIAPLALAPTASPPISPSTAPAPVAAPPAAPAVVHEVTTDARTNGSSPRPFSFSELWGDGEREVAKEVEKAIALCEAGRATLACDHLMTRVLASAAGLVGSADAPRDPGLVSLMLGLEGRRYLSFRALVRAARLGDGVTIEDALEAYAFAIEARRARESIGR